MLKNKLSGERRAYILLMKVLMLFSVAITAALVLFLFGYVLIKGLPNISWELLSTKPSYLTERIGILPDILNTLYLLLATLVVGGRKSRKCNTGGKDLRRRKPIEAFSGTAIDEMLNALNISI